MILKFLMFFSFGLLNVCHLDSQSNSTRRFKKQFIEDEHFGISKQPITNREYILFLCWNIHVHGIHNSFDFLPGGINEKTNKDFKLEDYISNARPLVRNYIFNPLYLDFPVIGLDQNQVRVMLKWLSDRYNENVLMRLGHLNFTPDQKDSDCFVLESYLTNQYTGSVRSGKVLHWNENKFLPVFRLPTEGELSIAYLNSQDKNIIRKYKRHKTDFLSIWNTYYLEESGNKLILNLERYHRIELSGDNSFDISAILGAAKDVFISSIDSGYTNFKYFTDVEYTEKNKDGKMSFVIVGENASNDAILGYNREFSDLPNVENGIYRIAYNRVLEFKYWP